jgi:DNA repair protein SbcD/Mre11
MKILHTSDWHLGRSLFGRKRYNEFSAFLEWLADTIVQKNIDVLLIAGDIFDTSTPSNKAQELYYRFLCRVANSCCRYIVVIAGNHDSPSFLNAPKELLRALNVHVVGGMTDCPEDEVIEIEDFRTGNGGLQEEGVFSAIICAVPYLRDKDIRHSEAGETIEDKQAKLLDGIRKHYALVCNIAEQRRTEMMQKQLQSRYQKSAIPIIAMGHLFAIGGKTVDNDGVRELYVGSLAHIDVDVFPPCIDYLALGHLHVPQSVGRSRHIRYSGSPVPMGYGEAYQKKSVVIVEFSGQKPENGNQKFDMILYEVPCFQPLESVSGTLEKIQNRINELREKKSNAWIEIEYTGSEIIGNLRERIDALIEGTSMEIRRIKNKRVMDRMIDRMSVDETLDDLTVNDVFERCLDSFEVPPENRSEMAQCYHEIVQSMMEEDKSNE